MKKILLTFLTMITIQMQAQCWKEVSTGLGHTIAIKTDGTLWGWGDNSFGQLGIATVLPKQSIYQISTDTNWKMVSASMVGTMAIKTDGTLWGWGGNSNGQLGTGNQNSAYEPTQIGTDTDWVYVSSRDQHTAAIKANGTLWTWGNNSYLQVGHAPGQGFYTPTQVGTDTDWKEVSASSYTTFATKTNGTLWAWGTNVGGMFGNGTLPNPGDEGYYFIDPVQIGSDTDWESFSTGSNYVAAIKTDGTLWTWGENNAGQLGNGSTTDSYIPVQVGTSTWRTVMCSIQVDDSFCEAIDELGVLYTWGANLSGQLGNGTTDAVSTPVAVNNDTDWKTVALSSSSGFAIKNDDTLYSWGSGGQGRLGNGQFNSPTPFTLPGIVNCEAFEVLGNHEYINGIQYYGYPNPTSSVLTLANAENLTIENLRVTDMTGKVVLSQNGNNLQIDVEKLPSGMYFLTVSAKEGVQNMKFIKE